MPGWEGCASRVPNLHQCQLQLYGETTPSGVARILEHAPPRGRLLDVGAGLGTVCLVAAGLRKFEAVVGIESSAERVAMAKVS